jgi:hypothetical protein
MSVCGSEKADPPSYPCGSVSSSTASAISSSSSSSSNKTGVVDINPSGPAVKPNLESGPPIAPSTADSGSIVPKADSAAVCTSSWVGIDGFGSGWTGANSDSVLENDRAGSWSSLYEIWQQGAYADDASHRGEPDEKKSSGVSGEELGEEKARVVCGDGDGGGAPRRVMRNWRPVFWHPLDRFGTHVHPYRPLSPLPDDMRDDLLQLWLGSVHKCRSIGEIQLEYWPDWRCLKPLVEEANLRDRDNAVKLDRKGHMPWSTFYYIFSRISCSDWGKQDRNGEPFASVWYDEGYPDAYTLTLEDNAKGVFELPFPHPVALATVQFLCTQRCESVKDVRFLCQWLHATRRHKNRETSRGFRHKVGRSAVNLLSGETNTTPTAASDPTDDSILHLTWAVLHPEFPDTRLNVRPIVD